MLTVVKAKAKGKAGGKLREKKRAPPSASLTVRAAIPAAVAAGLGKIEARMKNESLWGHVHDDWRRLVVQQPSHAQLVFAASDHDVGRRDDVRGKLEARPGRVQEGQENAQNRPGG